MYDAGAGGRHIEPLVRHGAARLGYGPFPNLFKITLPKLFGDLSDRDMYATVGNSPGTCPDDPLVQVAEDDVRLRLPVADSFDLTLTKSLVVLTLYRPIQHGLDRVEIDVGVLKRTNDRIQPLSALLVTSIAILLLKTVLEL
jgi:hypothetical protein